MKQGNTETLKTRVARIEAIQEIEKIQHKYQQYLSFLMKDEIIDLFANLESTTLEIGDTGIYLGMKGVVKFFESYTANRDQPGLLIEHYSVCPVIEVAKDLKTARSSWFSPGIAANGLLKMQIMDWGKYDCEYIMDNGKWKIWHMHWYATFEAEFEKGPLLEQRAAQKNFGKMYQGQKNPFPPPPDKPSVHKKRYSPNEVNVLLPIPPEPYDTWKK